MSKFGSIIEVFRPYFFTNAEGESDNTALMRLEDYGLTWAVSASGNASDEGFGPISTRRESDFTVEFENSVLLLLPNLILFTLVTVSAVRKGFLFKRYVTKARASTKSTKKSNSTLNHQHRPHAEEVDEELKVLLPVDNQLWRYRILLVLKLITSFICAALFVASAGTSVLSNAGGSNIFGCCVCAVGMLTAFYSSWRQHVSTWQPSITLQTYGLLMIFVLSTRLRTEWIREDKANNSLAIILSITLAILVMWTTLEVIPRITSAKRQSMRLPPDMTANIFSLMAFQYVQPLLINGFRLHRKGQDMDVEMLFPLRPDRITKRIGSGLIQEWQRQFKKRGSGNIWTAIFRLYFPATLAPMTIYMLYTATQFSNPMLLNGFLSWIATYGTDTPGPIRLGIEYAFGMCGITVVTSALFAVSLFFLNQTILTIRGAVISAVYQKALRLSPEEFNKRSIGDISNHISVDAESLVEGDLAILTIISIPVSMALGLYFVYLQLSWAVFPGLAWFLLICFGVQGRVGKQFGAAMKLRLQNMDLRVSLVNESISGIKFVKFNAWEKPFIKNILEIRSKELDALTMRAKVFGKMILTTQLSKNCTPLIMFWIYVMVIAKEGQALDANKVFVSLVIINLISVNIEMLSFALSWFYSVLTSMKRIQKFLNADELVQDDNEKKTLRGENTEEKVSEQKPIVFQDAVYTWSKSVEDAKFKLNIPALTVDDKEFLAVVGRVGSGKSSLLSAILGNMYHQEGHAFMRTGPVAYCSQSPFVMNATVEDNILFGQPYDKAIFEECVTACALDPDMAMLPAGIKTEIGERGIGLSGGQKARVALARACYSVKIGYTSVIILDDVLSAVDAHTDRHLFKHVLSSDSGLLQGATRVLVTHAVHHMDKVDRILYLVDGNASQLGTHSELMASEGLYRTLINEFGKSEAAEYAEIDKIEHVAVAGETELAEANKEEENGKLVLEEQMKSGRVTWKVYARFIKAGGLLNFFVASVILAFHRAIWFVGYYWLSNWLNLVNPTHSSAYYLGIYTLMQMLAVVSQPGGYYFALSTFGVRSSRTLFERMLNTIFRAPMSFFDTTPTGRLLNRLGSDMNQIDISFNDKVFVTIGQFDQVAASLIAAGVATPYLFALVPPLSVIYYFIMLFYQATARGLRRLDAGRTRAPMYQHITHTLEGMHTIKAFGLTDTWVKEFHKRVDLNQQSKRMEYILLGWMAFRLESLGAFLILATSIFVVIARKTIAPSVAGLAVSTLMNLVMFLSVLVQTISEMEIGAVHAERVLEFTEIPSEAPLDLPGDDDLKEWPTKGNIQFTNFSARYRKDLPLSLKNVTAKFEGGSKNAIVGRTGSGKSTLTLALFRIIEGTTYSHEDSDSEVTVPSPQLADPEKGSPELEEVGGSVTIDGVNVAGLGLAKLRSEIAIIPQDATMFGGTLRTNLSPFGEHSDKELWDSLEAAGLKKHVSENMQDGLDAKILPGGTNLSKGQLQQVGLARAMLRKAKILVLDEATSSMDLETDAIIQTAIRTHFSTCTVITIAHRIATILDSDYVLVMEAGSVAEYGRPKELLEDSSSLFAQLATETGQ
ncbi:hypothetical protein INT44_006462 [Umbelopsis vinacea]|uniref:P-loop containing nucleoside triphosphate hydrolase protein n=1 Tax=Umbelopsis vinacea TaxID=44442 RepID=A0A8H7PUA9_9FUNG|nr:hypothetical protein INT44_006462 [Umbelopsis vinacea]